MNVEVRPVVTRRERKLFLEYPWEIYRDTPQWMPPLRQNQKEMVGFARNPFHDDAEVQPFLAWHNHKVVGRIAAVLNHAHNRKHNEKRGFFGFFEVINDQEVANALFDAVRAWMAQRGITELRGPANPSLNHECGLLVQGFDKPPTFMMTYNPEYYVPLVESYGFRKVQDMYAFWGTLDMLPQVAARLDPVIEIAEERFGVKTRALNTKRFRQEIEMFLDVYNRSMDGMWGFVPMSPAEIRHMAGSLKYLIVPELCVVAEIEGKPIGAAVGYCIHSSTWQPPSGYTAPASTGNVSSIPAPSGRRWHSSALRLGSCGRWRCTPLSRYDPFMRMRLASVMLSTASGKRLWAPSE